MNDLITFAFARYQAGDLAAAEKAVRQALSQNANLADGWLLLGVLADHARAPADAENFLKRAAEFAPRDPRIWNTLGTVRDGTNDLDGARDAYLTAIESRPDYAAAWHNLGEVHRAMGRHKEAAEHYRKALAIDPHLAPAWSNLLFSLHFDPELSDAQIHEEHLKWGEALAARIAPLPTANNDPDPDRILNIGYIGPDFREHAVARFFEPLLAAHDRKRFRFVMYSECPIIDPVGKRLREHGDTFRIVRGQNADAVSHMIREDRIDILVELAGHTRDNRLDVMARRPAPVQMTFLGYPFGTGLPRIDYRITDGVLDPLDAEPRRGGAESLIRLPDGVCCFRPPDAVPDVNDLPMLKNGFITFGCHHPLPKLNPQVLKLWADVAKAVPTAKFLCVRNNWDGAPARELRQRFVDAGLSLDRVELRKTSIAPGDYLRAFHDMDVVLDAVPFNGHTMTCESLWMGVPVLTLRGDRPAGRLTSSVMTALGLSEFIADSHEEFVRKATELIVEPDRSRPGLRMFHAGSQLNRLRKVLRAVMRGTLVETPLYARSLEAAYREAWRSHCRTFLLPSPPLRGRGAGGEGASQSLTHNPIFDSAAPPTPGQPLTLDQILGPAAPPSPYPLPPKRGMRETTATSWDEIHTRGCAVLEAGNADEAAALFRQASALNPLAVPPRAMLAGILSDRCDLAGAAEQYSLALKAGLDAKVRIAAALTLPPIHDTHDQIAECRAKLIANIEALHADGVRLDPMRGPIPNLFLIAYQGLNDRDVMKSYAKLFAPSPWATEPITRKPSGKIKVGLISQYFVNHTIGTLNRGLVEKLDRTKFHVTVLSASGTDDETSRVYKQYANDFVLLPGETASAVRLIRSLGLDVALFTDLGMSCVTLALAHARLAPRQAVTWGHPLTTGINTIDDFISSELYEIKYSRNHYTERIVKLRGLNTFYQRPQLDRPYTRSEFQLPEHGNLYGCPQTLFKFHPDFDVVLKGILDRDPLGHLVLVEGRNKFWKERLLTRWQGKLPTDRIHWVGTLPRPGYLGLCSVCDVMLDPLHFGGGNTSLEALALGTPVVTQPSPYLRARLTTGFYKHMEMEDFVVDDAESYIALSLKLATDREYRTMMVAQLNERVPRLFEDAGSVSAYEDYFES